MLGTALQTMEELIHTLSGLAASSAEAGADVHSRAARFASDTIPRLRSAREDLTTFTGTALDRFAVLREAAQTGTPPADLVGGLREISMEFEARREKLTPLCAELDAARREFAEDVATLRERQTAAQSELAGVADERDRWAKQAAELRAQDEALDRFEPPGFLSIFAPVVNLPRVGAEIVSRARYGKSTEDALAEAEANFVTVSTRVMALDALVSTTGGLAMVVEQTVGAVQNLDNAASLLSADLGEDARIAACASPETLLLFVESLSTGMQTLRDSLN